MVLTPPPPPAGAALQAARATASRTASGSRAVDGARARVARGSRIFVEGRHDAELVEKVWGDDLRVEGVVVEMLDGVDDLAGAIRDFAPGPGRRMGVLVDHLVPGTKESRLVDEARARSAATRRTSWSSATRTSTCGRRCGPSGSASRRWPVIPRGTSVEARHLAELGWPHRTQADIALAWRRILGTVRSYADLEPSCSAGSRSSSTSSPLPVSDPVGS